MWRIEDIGGQKVSTFAMGVGESTIITLVNMDTGESCRVHEKDFRFYDVWGYAKEGLDYAYFIPSKRELTSMDCILEFTTYADTTGYTLLHFGLSEKASIGEAVAIGFLSSEVICLDTRLVGVFSYAFGVISGLELLYRLTGGDIDIITKCSHVAVKTNMGYADFKIDNAKAGIYFAKRAMLKGIN